MLRLAPGIKVYLACQPVDLRRGFDGLSPAGTRWGIASARIAQAL